MTNKHKLYYVPVFIFFILIFSYLPNYIFEYRLNEEFICPEKQTSEQVDTYLYKYTKFYMENYPNMTFSNFLSKRMNLLISNKCMDTLQNLAKSNNGVMPDRNSVRELKNKPYGPENLTLKEIN